MSRHGVLILLGTLTLLTPFSGLPGAMRALLAVIFGAIVLGIGLTERSRGQRQAPVSPIPSVPVESEVATPELPRAVSAI